MAAKRVGAGKLLASALSDRLGRAVVTYDQFLKEKDSGVEFEEIGVRQVFGLVPGSVPDDVCQICGGFCKMRLAEIKAGDENFQIFVKADMKAMAGRSYVIKVSGRDTVEELKGKIEKSIGVSAEHQRLMYGGKQLQDGRRLSDYNIQRDSTVFLLSRLRGGGPPHKYYINDLEMLDPAYDCDFTNMSDNGTNYFRGRKPYYRPYGWKRFALKVKGKYESDEWLGEDGYRTDSSQGEWPVSYRGTKADVSKNIAMQGYDMKVAIRDRFGKGIYSSPSIDVAESYAQKFPHEGESYMLVFQNRVSTEGLKIISSDETGDGEYCVQPDDSLIRPYGMCIKVAAQQKCLIL